jgi:hypothetical protein
MCYMDLTRYPMGADILTDVCNVRSDGHLTSYLANIEAVDSNSHARQIREGKTCHVRPGPLRHPSRTLGR